MSDQFDIFGSNHPNLVTAESPHELLLRARDLLVRDGDTAGWAVVTTRRYLRDAVARVFSDAKGSWAGFKVMQVEDLYSRFADPQAEIRPITRVQMRTLIAAEILNIYEETGGDWFVHDVHDGRVLNSTLAEFTHIFAELEPIGLSVKEFSARVLGSDSVVTDAAPQDSGSDVLADVLPGERLRLTADLIAARVKDDRDHPAISQRAMETALLYSRYQDRLVDLKVTGPLGLRLHAAERASERALPPGVSKVFIVGLDGSGLTDVAISLIKSLAVNPKVDGVWVGLVAPPGKFDVPPEKREWGWAWQGNEHLIHEFGGDTKREVLTRRPYNGWPADLAAMVRDPFAFREEPVPSTGAVRAVSVPDQSVQLEWVAQQAKAHIVAGTPADQVAIVAREMSISAEDLTRELMRLGVPCVSSYTKTARGVPSVGALLSLVRLHAHGWQFADLLAVAESPYLGAGLDALLLRRLADLAAVPEGFDGWMARLDAVIRRADETTGSAEDDEAGPEVSLLAQHCRTLRDALVDLHDALGRVIGLAPRTPREWAQATHNAVVRWEISERIQVTPRGLGPDEVAQMIRPDVAALQELLDVLSEWEGAQDLVGTASEPLALARFYEELDALAQAAEIQFSTYPKDAVHLLDPRQSALRTWEHVYVIDMANGLFPTLWKPGFSVLSDEERHALSLPTVEERDAQERLYFHAAVGCATKSLTLVTPAADRDGRALEVSSYLQAMPLRIEGFRIESATAMDVMPATLDDVWTREDEHLLAASHLRRALADSPVQTVMNIQQDPVLFDWLQTPNARRVMRAWGAEVAREEMAVRRPTKAEDVRAIPFAEYAGVVDPALLPERLGADAAWNPSDITTIEQCPMKYMITRLFGVRHDEDEEDESAQFGVIQHAVLQEWATELDARGQYPARSFSDVKDALELLRQIIDRTFPVLMAMLPERARRLDGQYLSDVLHAFVRRTSIEALAAQTDPAAPRPRRRLVAVEQWVSANFQVTVDGEAERFTLKGQIDRLEAVDDPRLPDHQGQIVITDLKSGTSMPDKNDLLTAKRPQLPLYAAIMEANGSAVFGIGEHRTTLPEDPEWLVKIGFERDANGAVQAVFPTYYGKMNNGMDPIRASYEGVLKVPKNRTPPTPALEQAAKSVRTGRSGILNPEHGGCWTCNLADICRQAQRGKSRPKHRGKLNPTVTEAELAAV